MFKNNTEEKYYLYNRSTGKTHLVGNKEDLIKEVAKIAGSHSFYWLWGANKTNMYKDIDFSGSDLSIMSGTTAKHNEDGETYYEKTYTESLKKYVFFDSYNRIVDVREFHDEILKEYKKKTEYKRGYYDYKNGDCVAGDKCFIGRWSKKNDVYVFRRGPVPGIRRNRYHRGDFYRHIRLLNFVKAATDVEYGSYVRQKGGKIRIPSWYDDYPARHRDSSWKTNTKCRHQWEKNLK